MKRETGWEVIGTALAVAASVLMVALLSGCRADGTENLRRELEKAVEGVDARVGIAVLSPSGESAAVNGGEDFPMMSVFKLHQALAVRQRPKPQRNGRRYQSRRHGARNVQPP